MRWLRNNSSKGLTVTMLWSGGGRGARRTAGATGLSQNFSYLARQILQRERLL